MAKGFFSGGKKAAGVIIALSAAMLLITSCNTENGKEVANNQKEAGKDQTVPAPGLPEIPFAGPGPIIDPGPIVGGPEWDTIQLMVRTDPADPHNERFLDDWRFQAFNIDDQARQTTPSFFAESGPDGIALLGLPIYMFALPLVIAAFNDVLPLADADDDSEGDDFGECRLFEIFIPPFCYDKAVWLLGPLENAVWDYYKEAAVRRGEAWNPSQVDCGTWLANLQLLILTDEISDELNELSDRDDMTFQEEALFAAFQENQNLLVPTRPPICMAERRHNGGGMERGEIVEGDEIILDDAVPPFGPTDVMPDDDPIVIDLTTGLVSDICGVPIGVSEENNLNVNGILFVPTISYLLDDQDFMGVISDQSDIVVNMDVSSYNVRLGNGRELDHDKYDDACALTGVIEFTNKDDDEQDVLAGSGITFFDLFEGTAAEVQLTSDGDDVVDDNDYWAIFSTDSGDDCFESVIAVELLGHRQEDFRDVLHMTYDLDTEDLFLGLRADYELNEEEVDGERAFLLYTIHVWDGSDEEGRRAVRENIANCYEASDVWARQFFVTQDFHERENECCFDEECEVESVICPIEAAEFAVRSQCFSNSRANQRWRTDDSGFWSMNTEHGVHGNVIVNPGWLAPDLDFEIYIQKFDEAVFKGPRTIRRTDDVGQLMAELPTLVEGDRVLIKAEDNCCDDYDLVIPCVPEFTGFAGAPGIPYAPITLGPPIPGPGPIGPILGPIGGPEVAPAAGGAPVAPAGGPAGNPEGKPEGESKPAGSGK